jgi:outer membrane protein OmpA-like peptidoglycan-associated protein
VACLGVGAADVLALNLLVRTERLEPAAPVPAPAALAREEHAHAVVSLEPVFTMRTERVSSAAEPRPPRPEPLLVLEFGSAAHWLDARALHTLSHALGPLRAAGRILVVGHADDTGPAELNERLSAQRAAVVARRLAQLGVERTRVRVDWRGARQPREDGESKRVEIYLDEAP